MLQKAGLIFNARFPIVLTVQTTWVSICYPMDGIAGYVEPVIKTLPFDQRNRKMFSWKG